MVVAVDTVEVSVEEQRKVLSVYRFEFQMLKVRQRNHVVFCQQHFLMIHFHGNASFPHPDKLVESLFFSERCFGMIRIGYCERSLDRKSTRLNSSHANISYAV